MKQAGIITIILSVATALCTASAGASNLPEPVLPAGVGVNIHFTRDHEKDLDLIAAAGFKFVRQDFFWSSIERSKGVYDWSEYDDLVTQLERRGMRAYLILDYSNPLYEDDVHATNPLTGLPERHTTASPQHEDSVAAFASWAAAAAKHFHGRGVIWEIWNEPNIAFWKPKPDVAQYTRLALATSRAIRKADPDATIVGPATSGFPWDFLESVFKSGVLEYLDAVSVHPYRPPSQSPERAAAQYKRLRTLIEAYAPEGKKGMPILSGEWGYSSNTKGVSREQQANFIARQQLANLLSGVPLSIWYDWKNDGNDPAENEHNFGIVMPDLTPKPAYTGIQTLTRELAGCRIAHRFDTGNTNDFVLVLSKGEGQDKIAAWTIREPHQVPLPLKKSTGAALEFVNGSGQKGTVQIENGHALLPLDGAPKYIDLQGCEISD